MLTQSALLLSFSLLSLLPTLSHSLSLRNCTTQLTAGMLDCTGRLPAGLIKGNFDFQGEVYECYGHGGMYTMCMGLFEIVPVIPTLLIQNFSGVPYFLRWGVCLPSSCDVPAFVEANGLQYISGLVSGGGYYFVPRSAIKVTYNPQPQYSAVTISFITFCSILSALVLIGSLYDLARRYRSRDDGADDEMSLDYSEKNSSAHRSTREGEGEKASLLGKKEEADRHAGSGDPNSRGGSAVSDFLLSFALLRNFEDFITFKVRDRRTAALDGFRLFAILWVVLGHTYLLMMYIGVNNLFDVGPLKQRFLFQFVANGTFSVDIFFVLSAFLLSLVLLKTLKKSHGSLSWPLAVFHRWWRLSPLYYFTVYYVVALGDMMVEGPLAGIFKVSSKCSDSWWSNLLYINNFTPRSTSTCIPWSWYLALDMQFFLLSLPIIFALHHKPAVGLAVIVALAVAGYIATIVVVAEKGYTVDDTLLTINLASLQPDFASEGGSNKNYFFDIYSAPWARIQTYLVGVTLGYICFSISSPAPLRLWQSLLAHVTSFVLMCIPIYSSYWAYDNEWVEAGNIIYIAFARTVFGIGFAGQIYLCYIGSGGFVDWFFSWPIFHILAKLTYGAYLFHFIVIELYFLSFPHLPYLSDSNAIMFFFACGVMTFVIAYALHLTVELPFAKLERVLLSPFMKSRGAA